MLMKRPTDGAADIQKVSSRKESRNIWGRFAISWSEKTFWEVTFFMMGCNNGNCGCGNNNCCGGKGGFFEGYEAFWIIVVIAIVIIWVQ